MERGLLNKVVEAEREIQAKIESEKKRCDEQLERARLKADERVRQEEAFLLEQCAGSVREAEENARKKAADIVENAARRAEKLKGLSDEALQKVAMKFIGIIMSVQ
jgi:vacuolar-type H+-ATPase subunit H